MPFLFEHLINSLQFAADLPLTNLSVASATIALPVAMVLGYGLSRATTSGIQ